MKKKNKETLYIGLGLLILSLLLHLAHFLTFRDGYATVFYSFLDIAFIPLNVFLTTLVIDKLLEKREKTHFLEKVNMLIGVFYTDLGTTMLSNFVKGDKNISKIVSSKIQTTKWNSACCLQLKEELKNHNFKIDMLSVDITTIRDTLSSNRDLISNLIINENMHEHEGFTEALMSLLHLREEMETRCCDSIQPFELEHIASDMSHAYKHLSIEWCNYMNYLSTHYPRLFLKALINNPFDPRDKNEKDCIYLLKNKPSV